MAGVVVLDAGVIIALFDPADRHHRASFDAVDDLEHLEFAASVVTVAEAMVQPAASGRAETFHDDLDRLGVMTVGLDDEDAADLAKLRQSTGLKMPDAIVLHTAIRESAELATTDERLARAAIARGVSVHVVRGSVG